MEVAEGELPQTDLNRDSNNTNGHPLHHPSRKASLQECVTWKEISDTSRRSHEHIQITSNREISQRVERRNTIGFKCDKDCTSQPGTTQQPVDNVEPYQLDQRYEDPLAEVHQCSSLRRGSHLMASELLRDVKSPTGLEGDSSMSTDKNVDDLLRSDILSNKKSVADLGGESEAFDDADAAEARWEPQNDLAWGDNRVQQGSVELSSGVALSLRKLEGKDQSKQGRGELFKPFDGTTGTGIFDQGSGSSSTMIFVGSHGVDGTQHVQTAGSVDAIRRLSAAHISSTSHNSTISKHGSYEMGFAEESNERPKLQLNAYSGDSGNPSITSWDSSKQPSETQQDFQDEALEDRRRDKLLLIWVGTFALAMAVAFLCLGTFAILAGKSPEESPDTHIAVCETAEWGEWTVCPTACGKSEQIRTRAIKALRISENRITLSGLGLDSTTGTKYWRVQFVFLVDKSLANSNPDADLGQDPQRTIARIATHKICICHLVSECNLVAAALTSLGDLVVIIWAVVLAPLPAVPHS
ncbi:thrombospondin type 1 domain-containing protein [Cyclospora cayetanensis]|uniref:Thrombospondin type 1 domain-containing protein n=1 Tax=Cyclospora cayetanensis TaxID=88456 RepID=A0A1D3D0D1_9EIME|nr:thrombospondin type 1 domain-containing protein [Cyclospora cayetanensis]